MLLKFDRKFKIGILRMKGLVLEVVPPSEKLSEAECIPRIVGAFLSHPQSSSEMKTSK